MADVDRTHLPIRRPRFSRGRRPDPGGFPARLEPHRAPDAARRRAERPARAHRRRRVRQPDDVRRSDRHAQLHPDGRGGLRYNRFHVTAICSPTRAALLTGRNNHAVGYGSIGEFAGGYPGYSATLPRDCAPLPRILRDNGYSTAAFGKWHLTPDGQQGPAGPFDRWPNGWGFDYFYGFLGGGAEPVGPGDGREPEDHRCRPGVRRRGRSLLHARRDGRQDDRVAPRRPSPGRREALLHLLLDRLQPRSAPRGETGRTSTRASSTRAGTGSARRRSRGRRRSASIPADAELTPRNEAFPAWDACRTG